MNGLSKLGPTPSASLLASATVTFSLLAIALGAGLYWGAPLLKPKLDNKHVDVRLLAALKRFEYGIVPQSASADAVVLISQADILGVMPDCKADGSLAGYVNTINMKLATMGPQPVAIGAGKSLRTVADGTNHLLASAHRIDLARLVQPAATDGTKVVSCAELTAAARRLADNQAAALEGLAWRETTTRRVVAQKFRQDQSVYIGADLIAQRNPWGGLAGCVYWPTSALNGKAFYLSDARSSNEAICTQEGMRPADIKSDDLLRPVLAFSERMKSDASDDWVVPPSMSHILTGLNQIRYPGRAIYESYTAEPEQTVTAMPAPEKRSAPLSLGPNVVAKSGRSVDVGYNVHLTIDPDAQRLVQQVATCFSGTESACKLLGIDADKSSQQMYEGAAARMVGVAVIDVATGAVEAIGSAHSECYRQEHDGPGRDATRCPNLPTVPAYRPDNLLNHALYTDAMPASTVKPIMAAGFLTDPTYSAQAWREIAIIQRELYRSTSPAFLNRMMCGDAKWSNCSRPQSIQTAAKLLGWDAGCLGNVRCGMIDILFGRQSALDDSSQLLDPLATHTLFGRLLTEEKRVKSGVQELVTDFAFDPSLAADCRDNRAWKKCDRHGRVAELVSAGWGQGNARATAVGVAGMMGRLAAAANGQVAQRPPHLVKDVTDAKGATVPVAAMRYGLNPEVPVQVPQAVAQAIFKGLSWSHRGVTKDQQGTAFSGCKAALGESVCNKIDWAGGKTGTPPYGNDDTTLAAIEKKCMGRTRSSPRGTACFDERPYKWYTAAFSSVNGSTKFDKTIAVLTERNWNRATGKVDSPGDTGPNVSATIAFHIMQRLRASKTGPKAAGAKKT